MRPLAPLTRLRIMVDRSRRQGAARRLVELGLPLSLIVATAAQLSGLAELETLDVIARAATILREADGSEEAR